MESRIMGGMMGLVVADALGVPVEFFHREDLRRAPVTGMRAYGTYSQPRGTWSDDSTMTLCLAESLLQGVDYRDVCEKFLAWMDRGYMTPHGVMFDIGGTTAAAIRSYAGGTEPLRCGPCGERDNGNGSLMRILPAAFYAAGLEEERRFTLVHNLSRLTHSHPRSLMACGIYVQLAGELLAGRSREEALARTAEVCRRVYRGQPELRLFRRVLSGELAGLPEEAVRSTGYVVDTLEAALWCLLTTESYRDCVLRAVNLGDDTDTVGAVAGGLAGTFYGYGAIPADWVEALIRRGEVEDLCRRFCAACARPPQERVRGI